jgi:hypothetical protein
MRQKILLVLIAMIASTTMIAQEKWVSLFNGNKVQHFLNNKLTVSYERNT